MANIQPGLMLTHYRLVEKLGEGGMGVVWKAFDTRLNRHVALKLLRAEVTSDPERQRRFMREARAAAAVSHPNIVTIHEVDEIGGSAFLCMELVEGRTLRAVIQDSKELSLTEVVGVATEVAEGLARAHREGIVHRDLKPENIIQAPDGHPKILDFGLAKLIESQQATFRQSLNTQVTTDLTGTGFIVGTAAYMSPEQVRGDPVDYRSDIFSLGVLLYELVSKRRPFQGSSQIATLAAILHEPAAPVSHFKANVPSRLEDILNKCLDKDPRGRYQSTEDLALDLRRLHRELESGPGSLRAVVKTAEKRASIAVLPFLNMSTEPAHSYFAGGLHDELLTQLAKVAGLKVISRTSVMGYKDTVKPLKVIAQELGVATIVEGSVQVIASRLRVNVQLIDAATDEHLWAERYDRTLDDAFEIQSDMAQQVVAAIGAALGAEEQQAIVAVPTENPEAYQLYLQAEAYHQRPGYMRSNFEKAQQFYEQALVLDPKFALAHAALSQVHGSLYFHGHDFSASRSARQREEAEKAVKLAPELPQAHVAMGRVHYWVERDYKKALEEFEIALRGLPNDAELWAIIAAVHRRLGNWEATRSACDKGLQLDPRSADLIGDLGGTTFTFLRRYSEAARAYDRSIALSETVSMAAAEKAWMFVLWKGDLDQLQSFLDTVTPDQEFGNLGPARRARAELLLLQRNWNALLDLVRLSPQTIFKGQMFYTPASLYAAWAYELAGNVPAVQTAYVEALKLLDSAAAELPDDWRVHDSRGSVLAGLGRGQEALDEVEWLRASKIYRFDAFGGPDVAVGCALTLARGGKSDAALDEIERVLAGPALYSVPLLRLDPRWDPIREHPRFKALLVKYANPE